MIQLPAFDNSELQTGLRFTGIVFATIGFVLKARLALGSASLLWIMAGVFECNTQMPFAPETLQGYRATSSLVVGFLFVICTLLVLSYKLNMKTPIEMARSLADRRKKAAA